MVKVGEDPASAVYVRNKRKACEECGIASFAHDLPATTTRGELLALVEALNATTRVDGILLQLPLPKGLDSTEIMDTIDPAKDVDGFHPTNTGLLAQKRPGLRPCTPLGRDQARGGIRHSTRRAARRAWSAHRTSSAARWRSSCCWRAPRSPYVTPARAICEAEVERAELVVAAVGKAGLHPGRMDPRGRHRFDVGINRAPTANSCGDVEYAAAAERAAWITPVPGGVGPMTIAMLLSNTVDAALQRESTREGR